MKWSPVVAAELTTGFGDECETWAPDVAACSVERVAAETEGTSAPCSGLPSSL